MGIVSGGGRIRGRTPWRGARPIPSQDVKCDLMHTVGDISEMLLGHPAE